MKSAITTSRAAFGKTCLIIAFIAQSSLENAIAEIQPSSTAFDDWTVKCSLPANKGEALLRDLNQSHKAECSLSQLIEFEGSNEPLLKVDLYLNPQNGDPVAIFVLPLGIPLNTSPILSFNNSSSRPLSVSHCHRDGCYFKMPLKGDLLEAFLSMQSGQIKLRSGGETLRIPISGAGSRSAYSYVAALPKL